MRLKLKITPLLLLLCVFLITTNCVNQNSKIQLGTHSNQEVIAAMTLEEKVQLLVGDDPGFPRGYPSMFGGDDTLFMTQPPVVGKTEKLVPGAAGTTFGIPRLGIPAIVLADGPAGVRIDPHRADTSKTYFATAFPIESLLACTWDTALVREVGATMGKEALEYGVDILLAPALNIHRNPLGGRNFEYYSEDPVISGRMAAAMVKGVQSNGVGTSIKHFAANNNETNRMSINAMVSEETLREIYLKGFEIAVKESAPWTVMSAYNKINGTYSAENPWLLDSVLRDQWGFDGFVMTDWFAGRNRIEQVKAGNDLLMPGSKYVASQIKAAVEKGELDEKTVDRNIDRILKVIKRTPKFKKYQYNDNPDLKQHAAVALQAATEGMVLLKNEDKTLPLKETAEKIGAFGIGTFETIAVGTGSGNVNMAYTTSIQQGLENLGYEIPVNLIEAYKNHVIAEKKRIGEKKSYFDPDVMLNEMDWSKHALEAVASVCDVGLFTISRTSGEFADRKIEGDFELTAIEKNMIEKLAKAFHAANKKLVVLLNIGGVIETASWKEDADAILLAWQPGQEAGNAVAQILSGKVSPSGKLTMSFPVKYADVPSSEYFPDPTLDPKEVNYEEGSLVGYRHYSANQIETSYEFGFGLSYTDFEYNDLTLIPSEGNKFNIELTVTNAGAEKGREVVQLYVQVEGEKMIQLKHFSKTALLQPGESTTLQFEITPEDLASYDSEQAEWKTDAGEYAILIGSSSEKVRLTTTLRLEKEQTL